MGSYGTIRHGYQLRIANELDEPVPTNTTGHLLLRSDVPNAFFQGHFNNYAATVFSVSNRWLHTGDLAKVMNKNLFYWSAKEVIRRGGETINASDIEEEILRHADMVMAAAFAILSELGSGTEDDIKVALTPRKGGLIDENDLSDWSTRNMARLQVLRVFEIVAEMRKTPIGKIEKR